MPTTEDIIRIMCDYLNEHNIEYSLVGGATLPLLGSPRSTFDVDIIARVDEKNASGLIKYLNAKGFLGSEEDLLAALKEKSHCTIEYKKPPYRIDLKGVYGEGEEWTLRNARKLEYLGLKVWVQGPEDAIASKLLFGGEQHEKDAFAIYVRQLPSIDSKYLGEACTRLGVANKLKSLIIKAKKYV